MRRSLISNPLPESYLFPLINETDMTGRGYTLLLLSLLNFYQFCPCYSCLVGVGIFFYYLLKNQSRTRFVAEIQERKTLFQQSIRNLTAFGIVLDHFLIFEYGLFIFFLEIKTFPYPELGIIRIF